MKKWLVFASLIMALGASAQTGYEITVTFKPFKNQYIYLGHYFGKQYPIIDSAKLNASGVAIFKGTKKLPGGVYLIGYPNKSGFFEMMIDKQQRFSVFADTATIAAGGVKFLNSPDNDLFNSYQHFMGEKGRAISETRQQLKEALNAEDSAFIQNKLTALDKEVRTYRDGLIKKNPNQILSVLLNAMREPDMPEALKKPTNLKDSTAAYLYFKNHFWDGVNFYDGRLAYTTFFEDKLDKYFEQLVLPQPDSVIKEIDKMLAYSVANEEMNYFLLLKFVNRYLVQKYMWEDKVFVHLFEKYFSSKNYSWLTEKGKKTITDRAYSLIANIMGSPAADIELPDVADKNAQLYKTEAEYTLVCFWDPNCGHCKEVLPKLDTLYRTKWKSMGLRIYAVAKENDATKKDWIGFINDHQLNDWIHVFYSKAADKARVDAGIPGYSQLYDVQTFPTIYLLDKDKRIMAKKLSVDQIDDVLALKKKDH